MLPLSFGGAPMPLERKINPEPGKRQAASTGGRRFNQGLSIKAFLPRLAACLAIPGAAL